MMIFHSYVSLPEGMRNVLSTAMVFWRRRHPNLTVLLPVNMNVLCFWFCLWYRSTFGKPFGYSDIHRGTGPFQFLKAHCYSTGG